MKTIYFEQTSHKLIIKTFSALGQLVMLKEKKKKAKLSQGIFFFTHFQEKEILTSRMIPINLMITHNLENISISDQI